jgi:hypothetical protein
MLDPTKPSIPWRPEEITMTPSEGVVLVQLLAALGQLLGWGLSEAPMQVVSYLPASFKNSALFSS